MFSRRLGKSGKDVRLVFDRLADLGLLRRSTEVRITTKSWDAFMRSANARPPRKQKVPVKPWRPMYTVADRTDTPDVLDVLAKMRDPNNKNNTSTKTEVTDSKNNR